MKMNRTNTAGRLLALLLLALMMLSLTACGTKNGDKADGMSSEPKNAEEAVAMHKDLMAQENAILSENTALWEKVFMAADKGMTMQEDGKNYGDFLLSTIESAKDQFTADELKLIQGEAEKIRDIETKLTMIEEKYPEAAQESTDGAMSVPAGNDTTTPPDDGSMQKSDDGSMQKFPTFEGKDLDGNTVKSDELFSANAVTVVNFWFTTCNPCVRRAAPSSASTPSRWTATKRQFPKQRMYWPRRALPIRMCILTPMVRRESLPPTSLPILPLMWLTATATSWANPS